MSIEDQLQKIQRVRLVLNDYEKELEGYQRLHALNESLPTKIRLTSFNETTVECQITEGQGEDLTALINVWLDDSSKRCNQGQSIIERILEVM